MRQSSTRNHRNRGWKTKHVLQICLLVVVGVWLLYQVKHSRDKKKAIEEGALKVAERVEESTRDHLKLGRKDPRESPVVTAAENKSHNQEEQNEEVEELAAQENKQEENEEEEGKDGGGDEIDEGDQDNDHDEAEAGEEFGDEEDKERHAQDVSLLENEDNEDDEEKSQRAREEQYKADDASSAVVKDRQELIHENGTLGASDMDEEHSEDTEKDEVENAGRSNGTDVTSIDDEVHDVSNNGENPPLNGTIPLNNTATGEREPGVESLHDVAFLNESSDHNEEQRNLISKSTGLLEQHDNSTMLELKSQNEQPNNSTGGVLEEQKVSHNLSTISGLDHQYEQLTNSAVTITEVQGVHNVSSGDNGETGNFTTVNEIVKLETSQSTSILNETTLTEGNLIVKNMPFEHAEKPRLTGGVEESDESHIPSSVTKGSDDAVQGEVTYSSGDASTVRGDQDAQTTLSTLPNTQRNMQKEEGVSAE